MTFVKKPFLARVVDAMKDKEELKSPVVVKNGDSMDLEITRLQKELAEKESTMNTKKIEQQIKYLEIGKAGEQSLLFELTNSFLPIMILHDVYIEHKGLNAQFDFIILTRKFFMVIEVKKYYGNITVNEKGEFIRTVKRGSRTVFKEGMYSPIRQVERQVEVLRSMLVDKKVIERTPILYAVAFANEKTVIDLQKAPATIKNKVFRSDGIVTFIKNELTKKSPVHFLDNKMRDLAEYINGQHINKHSLEDPEEEIVSFYTGEEDVPVAATVEVKSIPVSNEDLELKLKKFRKKTADDSGRKAFHIFTNKTLDSLLEIRPTTLDELRKIPGISDKKIEEFGVELVAILENLKEEVEVSVAATVDVEPIPVSKEDLELKLKKFRKKTADDSGLKAFHIFTNKTLDSLVEIKPTTLDELREIPGIGTKKIEEFGSELVEIIKENK